MEKNKITPEEHLKRTKRTLETMLKDWSTHVKKRIMQHPSIEFTKKGDNLKFLSERNSCSLEKLKQELQATETSFLLKNKRLPTKEILKQGLNATTYTLTAKEDAS